MRTWWGVAVFAIGAGGCANGASHELDGGPDMARADSGAHDAGLDATSASDAPPPVDLSTHDGAVPTDLGADAGSMDASAGDLGGDAGHDAGSDAGATDLGTDAGVTTATWSTSATTHTCPATVGMRFVYDCPAGGSASTVWGTGEYTNDSSICTAAVHSGHITLAAGGRITVEMRAGRASYTASTQHGVTSNSYGSWTCSFAVVAPACPAGSMSCTPDVCTDLTTDGANCGSCGMACTAPRVCSASACACPPGQMDCAGTCVDTRTDASHCGSCAMACGAGLSCTAGVCGGTPATWSTNATTHSCPADVGMTFSYVCPAGGPAGTAWGTDTYTHDSSICTAAAHVGRITVAAGGPVTIQMAPGAASYTGTTRNGITTLSYPAWSCSYTIP